MARWKTRSQKTQESIISKYMKMRKAMIEIRITVGLPDRAKLEDVVNAVKELAAKNEERR